MILRFSALPAFSDNYIWVIECGKQVSIVDPGDAAVVEKYLQQTGFQLTSILITHHHYDHTGGIAQLTQNHGMPVYGPAQENIPGITTKLKEGDRFNLFGSEDTEFEVLEVPGHTSGHIAYVCTAQNALLCGDTLFSGGCGRLFEGTASQMHRSLSKLAALPNDTRVYCTHEYTAANLEFALTVEPDNAELLSYHQKVQELRAANSKTLPSTIQLEKAINPFLRTDQPQIKQQAELRARQPLDSTTEVLATIRQWKDEF